MSQPILFNPPGQTATVGTDNTLFCVLKEMDRQSVSELTDRSQSGQPMGPLGALDHDDCSSPTLYCDDHGFLGSMLSDSLERAPSHRLVCEDP